jgi:hypothetical protein
MAATTNALRDEIKSALGKAGLTKVNPAILGKCTFMSVLATSVNELMNGVEWR